MIDKFSKQAGQNLRNGIGSAAGGAFAEFGKALANGENAAEAFAKSFISSIGQVAVQQGTSYILQGIALTFVPGYEATGTALIGAGAALAAFGGSISAVAGGGAAGAGAGAGADATNTTEPNSLVSPLTEPEDIEARETGPRVQLVVQGDILDSEQTGNRILDILNKNFSDSGGSLNGASFA